MRSNFVGMNHLREIAESPRIVEERRYRDLWREFLDGGGTKESLAHRALRISVNDKHAKSKSCIRACQVKACGTLPHAALLIDQAETFGDRIGPIATGNSLQPRDLTRDSAWCWKK